MITNFEKLLEVLDDFTSVEAVVIRVTHADLLASHQMITDHAERAAEIVRLQIENARLASELAARSWRPIADIPPERLVDLLGPGGRRVNAMLGGPGIAKNLGYTHFMLLPEDPA